MSKLPHILSPHKPEKKMLISASIVANDIICRETLHVATDLVYLENDKHFKKHYETKVPWKEVWIGPTKCCFLKISKTIKDF